MHVYMYKIHLSGNVLRKKICTMHHAASIQDTSSRKLKLRLAILKGLFHRTEIIYLYDEWTEINKEMNP